MALDPYRLCFLIQFSCGTLQRGAKCTLSLLDRSSRSLASAAFRENIVSINFEFPSADNLVPLHLSVPYSPVKSLELHWTKNHDLGWISLSHCQRIRRLTRWASSSNRSAIAIIFCAWSTKGSTFKNPVSLTTPMTTAPKESVLLGSLRNRENYAGFRIAVRRKPLMFYGI